jgi:hypothetical protein
MRPRQQIGSDKSRDSSTDNSDIHLARMTYQGNPRSRPSIVEPPRVAWHHEPEARDP